MASAERSNGQPPEGPGSEDPLVASHGPSKRAPGEVGYVSNIQQIWPRVARLRDISRLILVAIEKDDLEALARLNREGEAIVRSIQPRLRSHESLPGEFKEGLSDISSLHQRILGMLRQRKASTRQDLSNLREKRNRLRAARAPFSDRSGANLVDRDT